MPGEPKNQAPFTRRVKTMLAKALPKKRRPVKPPAPPKPPAPRPKPKPIAKPNVRQQMKAIMDLLLAHEPAVHYAEVRPMRTRSIRTVTDLKTALMAAGGVTMDCSESATLVARLAGAPDPNGQGYDQGMTKPSFTGTMLKHGHHVARSNALVGDIVVFGAGDGHHVCMVYASGPDPMLFSHGQERGPIKLPFSEESKFQGGPAAFLRFV